MKRRIFHLITSSIFAITALCGSIALAAPRICVLKYESGTTPSYMSGTPCTAAAAAYPTGGGKNLIKFDQGCGGSTYKVAVVFEQDSAAVKEVGAFQLYLGYDSSKMGTPATAADCNTVLYPAVYDGAPITTPECPGGSGATSYVEVVGYTFKAEGTLWVPPIPNIPFSSVNFSSISYTAANQATTTIAWARKSASSIGESSGANITPFTYQDADAYCESPPAFVNAPVGGSILPGTPTCAGDPPAGTVTGIKVSGYSLPTLCTVSGTANQPCPAGCIPGVTITKTLPGPSEVIASKTTSTMTTDATARPTGTQLTYEIVGVCTGSGASESTTKVTLTHTPACGNPPSFSTVKVGGKDPTDVTVGGLETQPIKITGTLTDTDSTSSQLSVGLYYGTEDNNPSFPTFVAGTVASDKTFSVDIPGAAVKQDNNITWALWATDQVSLTTKSPGGYDGTSGTAYVIDGANILKGTALAFVPGTEPYPNQFPFRAAGQRLIVSFQINDSAAVTMRIYSMDGTLVRQIENSSSDPSLFDNVCKYDKGCSWDGTNYLGNNNWVANGMYIVNIYAVGTGTNFGGQTISYTKGLVVMK